LWIQRNTGLMSMYATSMMSKCLCKPSKIAYNAALHAMHYMHANRHTGITYRSDGNLEPICFYDSGYNQKHLGTRPQYAYVIIWAGAAVVCTCARLAQASSGSGESTARPSTPTPFPSSWARAAAHGLCALCGVRPVSAPPQHTRAAARGAADRTAVRAVLVLVRSSSSSQQAAAAASSSCQQACLTSPRRASVLLQPPSFRRFCIYSCTRILAAGHCRYTDMSLYSYIFDTHCTGTYCTICL
jgi:hypothetical protein